MTRIIVLSIFFSSFLPGFSQDFSVEFRTLLSDDIRETSGLIFVEGHLITHNDSGDGPYLYELDTLSGEVIRTVFIENAGSIDWEDITIDETFIYIGDIGNNAGTRTDLAIYRIEISDFLINDIVTADTILFSYADQVDFSPAVYTTNYDAEAIIAYNDSIYLFSKNWGDLKSNIYSIPKVPGTYSVHIIDQINSLGLVTGATYDASENEIVLCGYTILDPFVILLHDFEGIAFSAGTVVRATPPFLNSIQTEGIASVGNHLFFISSETADSGPGSLHKLEIENYIGISEIPSSTFDLYPNPSNDILFYKNENLGRIEIYSLTGQLLLASDDNKISIATLPAGTYIFQLINVDLQVIHTTKFIRY